MKSGAAIAGRREAQARMTANIWPGDRRMGGANSGKMTGSAGADVPAENSASGGDGAEEEAADDVGRSVEAPMATELACDEHKQHR